jgi:hypothetical protein
MDYNRNPINYKRDCAYANGFTVFSECLDVVIIRIAATTGKMCFGLRGGGGEGKTLVG